MNPRIKLVLIFLFVVTVSGCTNNDGIGNEGSVTDLEINGNPVTLNVTETETREVFFSFERSNGALLGYRPEVRTLGEGEKFVLVKANFTNNGENSVESPYNYVLESGDSTFESVEEENSYRAMPINRTVQMNESSSGWLIFKMPRNTTEFKLTSTISGKSFSIPVSIGEYRSKYRNLSLGSTAEIKSGSTGAEITVENTRRIGENLRLNVTYLNIGERRIILPGRESFFVSENRSDRYSVPVQIDSGERKTKTYTVENYTGQRFIMMDMLQGREKDFILQWRIS